VHPRCSPKWVRDHLANKATNFRPVSLAGHRTVGISSANRLGNRRDASGSPSLARGFSGHPASQEPHDRAQQTLSGQCC
jgi:hypothetical protein